MSKYPKIRKYLRNIENELIDINLSLKKSILREIEEHLNEKVEDAKKSKKISKISSSEIDSILKDFGEPKEIAIEYRRQLSEERMSPRRKKGSKKKRIMVILIFIFLMSSILIPIFNVLWLTNDEGNNYKELQDNIIYPGIGLKNIQVGDTLDKIIEVYGEPEDSAEGSNTIGLSYREKKGMNFLLRKESEKIIEIRFNSGFDGQLENGLKIGSELDEVLNKSFGALKTVQANVNETQLTLNGTDKVLYEQIIDGNINAYKFIDAKKGILYWFDTDKKVSQIVVYKPFGN